MPPLVRPQLHNALSCPLGITNALPRVVSHTHTHHTHHSRTFTLMLSLMRDFHTSLPTVPAIPPSIARLIPLPLL